MLVLALGWLAQTGTQARAQEGESGTSCHKFADPCWDKLYEYTTSREAFRAMQAGLPELMQQLHPDDLLREDKRIERGCLPVVEALPHRHPATRTSRVPWSPDPHPATRKPRMSGTPDAHPGPPTPGGPGTPDLANLYLVAFATFVREFDEEKGWREIPESLALALVALRDTGSRISGDGASFSVVAKTPQPLKRTSELDRFDFAAYQLNENEMAFGLRSHFQAKYGGGGRNEILELFRVKDSTFEPVLRTLMASSSFAGVERGDREGAEIHVLKTKTRGVFDLKKSVRGGRAAIFRWNGHAYESHDPEPVICVNAACNKIKRELKLQRQPAAGHATSAGVSGPDEKLGEPLNDRCKKVQWELASESSIDSLSNGCPSIGSAEVLSQAEAGAGVLGKIPDRRQVGVYLSWSTPDFYRVEGNGSEQQEWLSGYVLKNCVRMDTGEETRPRPQ